MDINDIQQLYLSSRKEIESKISKHSELMHLQMDMISSIVTSSIFDFNLLETRLDDIIFRDYILDHAANDSDLFELGHFKEEVLRGGIISFSDKTNVVSQITKRRGIQFKKGYFIDLAGIRNQIAHGLMNFDPDGELGIEVCLYGRKMEKLNFEAIYSELNDKLKLANDELDKVYRKMGMFVKADIK